MKCPICEKESNKKFLTGTNEDLKIVACDECKDKEKKE